MPNIDLLVLAIVQGITEFLPVSASGHLLLIPQFYCWPTQGLVLQVAAEIGLLLALIAYFWRDLLSMSQGAYKVLRGKRDSRVRLIGLLLVAAIPALAAGYAGEVYLAGQWNSPLVVAGALIGFGALLYIADKMGLTVRRIEHLSFGSALAIGIFQCLAVIPGASRVGLAMTIGRIMGFERPDAVRFSFLLSIPVIFFTGLYKGWLLFRAGEAAALQNAGLMIALVAIAGFLAIAFLMYWVRRASFTPFVAYRLALGLFVLYVFYLAGGPAC
ncbi:MAG TPA: undecaprenyl-diphosphate phosphatase [Dongiaceae bacterium]|nr:undecaprenyl-diphosphate phosphatase [Dongiaceae bacterium]